jgi:DNA-binding beta-propeller fold protein YncE
MLVLPRLQKLARCALAPDRLPRLARLVGLALLSLACIPLAGAAAAAPLRPAVVFEAPAGNRPAGPTSLGDPFGGILPSGRFLHPAGTSVVVGMNALGVTLSPDGRFAIVSNDDERQAKTVSALDGLTTGGYSLAVVDVRTMTVVSRYAAPKESFFIGLAALRDPVNPANVLVLAAGGAANAVFAFDLDPAGRLLPDEHHLIEIPGPSDPRNANAGHSFPSTIVLSASGARAYVIDNLGNDVAQIDTASRSLVGSPVAVGYFPLGAALSPEGLIVADEGLMNYENLDAPAMAPPFGTVPADLARASSLALIDAASDQSLGPSARTFLPLDPTPDGVRAVGGAHPVAVVAMQHQPYAFVALGNVDRIATVSLSGIQPQAVGGTELRLYDRGPYGTQPVALALSRDERRLYVALAGYDPTALPAPHRFDSHRLVSERARAVARRPLSLRRERQGHRGRPLLHGRAAVVHRQARSHSVGRSRQQRDLVDARTDRFTSRRLAAHHAARAVVSAHGSQGFARRDRAAAFLVGGQ